MIRIALAQMNSTVGDLPGNTDKILRSVEEAQSKHVDLIVFPELSLCGYPPEDLLYKNHFIQDNIKQLHLIAEQIDGIAAVVGFVDQKEDALYNAAAVLSRGKVQGIYHKEELPNYGVFDEKRYFQEGENNVIYGLGYDYFSVNICEDLWVDDGIYKRQALQGASLIVNISSSPYDDTKYKTREALVQKRAQETNSFVAYVNLVGGQDELVFDGGSFVCSPQGEVLARAPQFEEHLLVCDLGVSVSRERKYKPFDLVDVDVPISKNKPDVVTTQAKELKHTEAVYKALVLGTRDYIQKNGFQKVLIGLSGGIDSALVAKIAVDAIGSANVKGVTMPSRYTTDGTKSDAIQLAENLGIECDEIAIEDIFKSYLSTLEGSFKGEKVNIAEENIQARIRGNILMALSNKFGWLVLTTGNKSEVAVGYCTLYGDMSGGFAVIKDVPKTLVYEISEWLNKTQNRIIPPTILTRPPTAELKANQTDQDSLPPYDRLDRILEGYVGHHASAAKMSKIASEETILDVVRKVDRNEYKRRQAPPGIKITQRAFGKDWRLPITNKYKGL